MKVNRLARTSLFIPTYNAVSYAKKNFLTTLQTIKNAQLHRVLIIDSSSTDDTCAQVAKFGFELKIIPQQEFNHSLTRHLAYTMLAKDSEFIIYITQDVLISDTVNIVNLVAALLESPNLAGVYGRQLPQENATIFAQHLRYFNYANSSYIYSYADRLVHGMKIVFSSDSFAAYRVSALDKIGGFATKLILGEDVYLFAKFLQHDLCVGYVAHAICQHSHNYSLVADFRRYFDIGVFYRTQSWIMNDFGKINRHGLKFVLSELKFIGYRFWHWPEMCARILAKYVAYKLGYNFKYLGLRLCRKLTANKSFW